MRHRYILALADSLLKIEAAVVKADDEEYNDELQRLLQSHRNRIRDVVQAAMLPLIASIPNPVRSAVIRAYEDRPI